MPEHTKRSIPSLDGLRALAVCALVLGHTPSPFLDRLPLNQVWRRSDTAVDIFFVISGFLITHLLLKELARDGNIDLRRFYIRRTFRIFPPFYAFLATICILKLSKVIFLTWGSFFAAATYTWNYVRSPETWVLGHCWSLSLEEQYYLLWPLLMKRFSRLSSLRIAVTIILLSPISRVVTYFVWPSMRGRINMMLHTHLDTIMMGCALSLIIDLKLGKRIINIALMPAVFAASVAFLAFVDIPAKIRWKGMYLMTVGISLENIAIASILLFVVFRHESIIGRILGLKPLKHIGLISYSIYLWQQLFTGYYTHIFPLNLVWIVLCAELSYFLIERPSLHVRDRVQRWLDRKKPLLESSAAA